jgi:hypothetical protein
MSRHSRLRVLPVDEGLPVMRAWRASNAATTPVRRLEMLKNHPKSQVYRLVGADASGGSVIAKRSSRATLAIERHVYEQVLPSLPVAGIECLGFLEDMDEAWLFMQDVGPETFDRRDPRHRHAAASWLATLHLGGARMSDAWDLPDRGVAAYRSEMQEARSSIIANVANPALGSEDRRILQAVVAQIEALESRWEEVEVLTRSLPMTIIHGDLRQKNMRLVGSARGDRVVAIDWETAGMGFPAVDLGDVDATVYWAAVSESWGRLEPEEIARLASVGRVLRWLHAERWATMGLHTRYPAKPMIELEAYQRDIATHFRVLGWAAA